MPVNSKHPEYQSRVEQWKRCRDVYEGSDAVKAAGEIYLPRPSGQDGKAYDSYKSRAMFYEAFGRTVDGFVGSIARKPPKVDAPDAFDEILEDVTANGVGLLEFIKMMAAEVFITSRVGVLVEWDEDESQKNPGRPYMTIYKAEQIINWFEDGSVVLEEVLTEPDAKDPFLNCNVTQWRYLHLVEGVYTVTIYRKRDKSSVNAADFYIFEERIPSRRKIPFDCIPFYMSSRNGSAMTIEKPPLLGLADVVISHYKTSADLEHGRHFTALPTLYISGMSGQTDDIHIGGGSAIILNDPQAKVGYAEFSGTGLASLDKGLEQKEHQMAILGAALFNGTKGGVEAADTARIRTSGENSLLSGIVSAIEEDLENSLQMMVDWLGLKYEIDLHINRDFIGERIGSDEVLALVAAYTAGTITLEVFLHNLQTGEMLPPEMEIEEQVAELKALGAEKEAKDDERALAKVKANADAKAASAAASPATASPAMIEAKKQANKVKPDPKAQK